MPEKFGTGFDVICKQPVFDSKSYIQNCTYDNFQQNYTGVISSACGNNFVFKPHEGASDDLVGSAYLYDSVCSNCDNNSYLTAIEPRVENLGWFGGCGDMVCTGLRNYLVQDFTGTFFGFKGAVVPTTDSFGANEAGCVFSTPMNSFLCTREDLAVLEYQNVHTDQKLRMMWPVTLFYDGSNYTTKTNGFRDW